jgi:hypothetical protein
LVDLLGKHGLMTSSVSFYNGIYNEPRIFWRENHLGGGGGIDTVGLDGNHEFSSRLQKVSGIQLKDTSLICTPSEFSQNLP